MNLNSKTLLLASLPLLTVRVAWFAWPSLALGVAFWGALLLLIAGWATFLGRRAIPRHCVYMAAAGALLNGIVVVANSGYMPVHSLDVDAEAGIWRSAEHGGNLLFLADRMSWGGASPGDFFLAAGIAIGLSIAVTRAVRGFSRRRSVVSA
jgi:hypothetical protein